MSKTKKPMTRHETQELLAKIAALLNEADDIAELINAQGDIGGDAVTEWMRVTKLFDLEAVSQEFIRVREMNF